MSTDELERIAKLEAKMDTLILCLNRLTATIESQVVQKSLFEAHVENLRTRIEKIEAGPTKWIQYSFPQLVLALQLCL